MFPRHLLADNAIAGKVRWRNNANRGVTNERQGSTDAAADRICGRPGWVGRGPLGLPDSPEGQQGIGRGAPRPARRGCKVERDSDAAAGSQHRRLSPGLISAPYTLKRLAPASGEDTPLKPAASL